MRENLFILCCYIIFKEDSVYYVENLEKVKVFIFFEKFLYYLGNFLLNFYFILLIFFFFNN